MQPIQDPGLCPCRNGLSCESCSTRAVSDFWNNFTWENGQTIIAHAGQTGGYASYLGIDRSHHKAVIGHSDGDNNANDLGIELLIDHG